MTGITAKTRLLGVFGSPIGHSLSPVMHNAAFRKLGLDCLYLAFDVDPRRLESAVQAIRSLGMPGVNVTIPHKEKVIPFLDEVSREAGLIGSVNTIINRDGRLFGASTDEIGFLQPLLASGVEIKGKKAVVIGAGGSARAVLHALATRGASVTLVNRTVERAEELAARINEISGRESVRTAPLTVDALRESLAEAALLVNSASLGMWPNTETTPCPDELLHPGLVVYDLVYNPLRTRLIQSAEKAGATAISGLKMLVHQGAASFEMWFGQRPPVEAMEAVVLEELAQRSSGSAVV